MKRGPLFGISAILIIAGLVTWLLTRPKDDGIRVPLGVEQAAIVTHGGPVLVVAPYKWGVAVNVRIAEVIEKPDRRIYDVRYIVNREGTFDLKDYLAAEDGRALDSLPSFQFTGDPRLSKNLDTQSIPLSKRFIEPNNPKLDPPSMPRHGLPDELWGGTFIGKALHGAADLLAQRPTGDRMIILMTDGESSDINPPLDVPIIDHLRAENITVFTIMLTGEKISEPLVRITRATGGEVFNAVTPEALASVFKRIDEMKKVVVLEKRPRVIDFYDPFFIPALGVLAAIVLAAFGLRFTPW